MTSTVPTILTVEQAARYFLGAEDYVVAFIEEPGKEIVAGFPFGHGTGGRFALSVYGGEIHDGLMFAVFTDRTAAWEFARHPVLPKAESAYDLVYNVLVGELLPHHARLATALLTDPGTDVPERLLWALQREVEA